MKKDRLSSLDLLRTVAIIFVIILHSISISGALSRDILTPRWTLSLYLRQISYTCVPLFIMLTGYLQRNKRLSLSYYKALIPLSLSYAIISILSLFVRAYYDKSIILTPVYVLVKLLDFSANEYGWYFEMYIGLFLLIPFLNTLYSSISTRTGKLTLIFTLSFLTLTAKTVVGFSPYYGSGTLALNIIPDFFDNLYPVTYYYIGAFFSEYKPFSSLVGAKRLYRLLSLVLSPLIPTAICYYYTRVRGAYSWYMLNGMNTLTVALSAVCVFAFFYDLEVKGAFTRGVLKILSETTFEVYLLSAIFDSVLYWRLHYSDAVVAVIVYLASLALACPLRYALLNPVSRLLKKKEIKI